MGFIICLLFTPFLVVKLFAALTFHPLMVNLAGKTGQTHLARDCGLFSVNSACPGVALWRSGVVSVAKNSVAKVKDDLDL